MLPLALGLLALLRRRAGRAGAAVRGLGVAACCSPSPGSSPPGRTATRAAGAPLGGYAMPYAFAGGALLSPPATRWRLPGLRWIGAPELLAGSAALVLAALLGTVGVAARTRIFVAATGVGLGGAAAALTAFALPAPAAAAVVLSRAGPAPSACCRCWRSGSARLPMPPVAPADDAGPGAAGGPPAAGRPPWYARGRPHRGTARPAC